jgi:hypothetical protein
MTAKPLRAQEPEERTQRRRRELHRPRPVAACQRSDELDHVTGVDLRDPHRAVGEHCPYERPHEPGVVALRRRTHAAGAAQMLIEGREQFLQRQSITSFHQLLLVFRPIGHKKRRDYVQLRPLPANVKPSQRKPARAHPIELRITTN